MLFFLLLKYLLHHLLLSQRNLLSSCSHIVASLYNSSSKFLMPQMSHSGYNTFLASLNLLFIFFLSFFGILSFCVNLLFYVVFLIFILFLLALWQPKSANCFVYTNIQHIYTYINRDDAARNNKFPV